MSFDVVINNGRYFDGTGGPSAIRNVGPVAICRAAVASRQPRSGYVNGKDIPGPGQHGNRGEVLRDSRWYS